MIQTHHLSKVYSRGLYALRDLSLTVDKGEFVFLTGPSGAGKSTFLRLLLMQERPSEGELLVNGHDLSRLTRRAVQEYRRGIGFIFQDFKLIPSRTVLENICFVPEVLGVPVDQGNGIGCHQRRTCEPACLRTNAETISIRRSRSLVLLKR